MTENEFMLADRIAKIQSINQQFDLENNAYLSFSGGKDSTVLHYLLDEAIPGNKIPRVFINTGIEYKDIYAKQCETIWKPVYDEYRRLHYRLSPKNMLDL